jgi:hypothetical protein
MSSGKHKSNSVLLPALPTLYNLETPKQQAIFRMLGVDKDVREEVEALYRRLGIKKYHRGEGKRMLQIRTFWNKILVIDTQLSREKALAALQKLITYALDRALDSKLELKRRMQWARTVSYLFQTWSSIANSYDMFQIKAELEKLKERVKNDIQEGN